MDGTHREHPPVDASRGEEPAAGIHSPHWHVRLVDHGRRTMARVRSSCLPLMVAMFLLLGLSWAFDREDGAVPPLVITMYAAVPMLGVLLLTNRTWAIAAFVLLVASNAALFVSPSLAGEQGIMHWPGKLLVLYYGVIIIALVRVIFFGRRTVRDRVYGGVAVFLLFGVVCAIFYRQMLAMDPGALHAAMGSNAGHGAMNWNDCVYFSFVTLATIGFGDIVPGNSMVRSLAMIEGLMGVLYPAVLLARLVSKDE